MMVVNTTIASECVLNVFQIRFSFTLYGFILENPEQWNHELAN